MRNQFKIKKLPDQKSIRDAISKRSLDNKFNEPSIIKKPAHVDFND